MKLAQSVSKLGCHSKCARLRSGEKWVNVVHRSTKFVRRWTAKITMTFFKLFGVLIILVIEQFDSDWSVGSVVSKLKIGTETTIVDGPLKLDGTIDYEAAFNAKTSGGVTPENNALVFIERAFGPPADLPAELKARFYRYLGVQASPPVGDYILSAEDFVKKLVEDQRIAADESEVILAQISDLTSRTWTHREFPVIAEWIVGNDKPLKLLEQAALRSRFYLPIVTNDKMDGAPLPFVAKLRQGSLLLRTRATFRMSRGDWDGAWEDLMTNMRISRLVGRYPLPICNIVGAAMDASDVHTMQILLGQPLTDEQISRFQTEYLALPAVMDIKSDSDLFERFMAQENALELWKKSGSIPLWNPSLRYSWIDINVVMRRTMTYYESMKKAHQIPEQQKRKQAIVALLAQMRQRVMSARKRVSPMFLFAHSRRVLSELFADLVIGISAPDSGRLQDAQDRSEMRRVLLTVAFAARRYRAMHGEYPAKLDLLVPEFLAQVTIDFYSGLPLHYRRKPYYFIVYSVGANQIDDVGKPFDVQASDDIILEVPHTQNERDADFNRQFSREIAQRQAREKKEQFEFDVRVWGAILFMLTVYGSSRVNVLFRQSRLRIGPATTVVEGPVKADGTVDFESALHLRSSAGVSAENNAAILLEQAFGPQEVPVELRSRYYHRLGMEVLPSQGNYLVDEQMWIRWLTASAGTTENVQADSEDLSQGVRNLWKRDEFPRLAAWIDVNEEPLQLIQQACQRARCYSPLVNDGPLWDAALPLLKPAGVATRLFASRTMLRISDGDLDGAISDLLTCHRFASLLGQGPNTAANLVAFSMDAVAVHCAQFLLSQSLTSEQIERYQTGLATISEVANFAVTLQQGVRLQMLDGLQFAAASDQFRRDVLGLNRGSKFDLNIALRRANSDFDKLDFVLQTPVLQERIEKLAKFQSEISERGKRSRTSIRALPRLFWRSREKRSQAMADVMLGLMLPDVQRLLLAQYAATMRREMLRISLALASFRVVHGDYPQCLGDLVPNGIQMLQTDNSLTQSWHYAALPAGYLLRALSAAGQAEDAPSFCVTHLPLAADPE
jgi:hypothetical protein